jgi:hypothetical protein
VRRTVAVIARWIGEYNKLGPRRCVVKIDARVGEHTGVAWKFE